MTGYGVSCWKTKDCYIEVIVQSYNSKHFEARAQLPPFYAGMEGEFRKELQKKFQRGTVNLLITRNPSWPLKQTNIRWNKEQAIKWKALYKKMAISLKMENDLSLHILAQQPGVLEIHTQPTLVSAIEKQKLKSLFRTAINLCNKERVREGLALKHDFQKNTKQLFLSLQKIKRHSVRQSQSVRKNIKKKIDEFIDDRTLLRLENSNAGDTSSSKNTFTSRASSPESVRAKMEEEVVGALINRMDIGEEISRMEEHIRAFQVLISAPGVIGKKMSFYLQEMIREMNTIGAKSQDFKLTKEVVHSKNFIEKLREQVQNVE